MIPSTTIIRSKKRKRTVALHVEADGSVIVTAPVRTSLSWINAFIVEKADWIARRRAAWQARQSTPPPVLADGCIAPFLGTELQVMIHGHTNKQITSAPEPHPLCHCAAPEGAHGEDKPLTPCLCITLPNDVSPECWQAELKTELTLWYKKQARRVFAERMTYWAAQMAVSPSRLIITNPARRWGSCSVKDEIRLNWRLIMASPDILDYVIVHELCHIPHKNHGKRFWALVERFTPNAKKTRQQLRNFEKSPFQNLFV
ncbi:MAG: SprT family zinc-dependent metalloprotease [Alphaproteobacteria bacterium]|nr:SprT family zinc-dependent metalloprotease [Alphaproteobacteria bacterium]